MTYISNTITDANSPATMCTALETALTSTGYTLTDTVVISTRTHRIWKNPAANNASGQDWYVDIAYTTTGTGTFGIYLMEGYDPVTHLAYRAAIGWPYYSGFTVSSANSYTPYGTTGYSLEATQWSLRAGVASDSSYGNRDVSLPSTSFGYWISVTTDRIAALFSVSPSTLYYTGLYEASSEQVYVSGSSVFPLVSAAFSGNAIINAGLALTRYPKMVGTLSGNNPPIGMNMPYLMNVFYSPSVPGGDTSISRKFALRVPLYSGANAKGLWGYFIDVACVWSDAIVTRGDTVTDDTSAVWLLTAGAGNISVMMKRV